MRRHFFPCRPKDCRRPRVSSIVMRMETSDEALALASALGDREAFSALIARHYDRICGLSFRLTGSRPEADDLALPRHGERRT